MPAIGWDQLPCLLATGRKEAPPKTLDRPCRLIEPHALRWSGPWQPGLCLNSVLASDFVSGSRSFADGLAVAHLRRPGSIAHSRIPTLLGMSLLCLRLT